MSNFNEQIQHIIATIKKAKPALASKSNEEIIYFALLTMSKEIVEQQEK